MLTRGFIDALSRRTLLACAAVGLLAIGLRLALVPLWGMPQPAVEDEFSYLLQGETFAAGRMTNPPHPMWRFFETIHVNMQPTYAGKYPPGQAIFLAIGIRLFGHPWYGVLLSVGLMCGCICWMVQGWLPPRYGLMVGVIAALEFAGSGYWVNSYWGGAVAAVGGALVLGALPRILRRPSAGMLAVAAVGIVIMLNTRPYEGLVLILGCFIALVWRSGRRFRTLLHPRLGGGALLVLAAGAGTMAMYNHRVTGDAFELPYMVNQRRYALAPPLWVESLPVAKAHSYRDWAMRDLWEWDLGLYRRARERPLRMVYALSAASYGAFLDGPMLFMAGFAGIGFVVAVRKKRLRPAAAVAAGFVAGVLLEKFILPHYLAPATALVFLFTAIGLRGLWTSTFRGTHAGPVAVTFVLGICALLFASQNLHPTDPAASNPLRPRLDAMRQLERTDGKHVVLVRYGPTHDFHAEYVYNGPNIDQQHIVWAVDRGPQADSVLQRYYPDRSFWLLQPDGPHPTLTSYRPN